jgi:hypothetical protein
MGFGVKLQGNNPGPRMSALGQKQTLDWRPLMSALPPKADIRSGTLAMAAKATGTTRCRRCFKRVPVNCRAYMRGRIIWHL